jgi:flagellar biosynthesis/type III secretory pathway protein FliH
LQAQLRQDLNTLEEESKMVYITSIEQLAKEEGMQAGMQKGIQKGMQQGLSAGKGQALTKLLVLRFGELPPWAHEYLARADENTLDGWIEAVLSADTLESVFAADLD